MSILLWPSVHILLRDSCEQYKPWLILFFFQCFELWTHVSQHWLVPFYFGWIILLWKWQNLHLYCPYKHSVLSHAVSVGCGVCQCVYICVYVYITQQACHASVWWQSNKYNKSQLQNSLWFLEVLGRGRVSWQNAKRNPKFIVYIDTWTWMHKSWPALASAIYMARRMTIPNISLGTMQRSPDLQGYKALGLTRNSSLLKTKTKPGVGGARL